MTVTADAPTPAPVAAPSRPARRSLFSREHRALSVGSIALAALIAFEALAVSTAMPTVAKALDGIGLYALAFGGTLAAGVVSMVVSGLWNDRSGPAHPMWTGVALFVVGLILAGTATTMWTLIGGRVVQGLGGGMLSVSLYVVVGRAFPKELHPRIFAAFAAAWVVPSIVGPALTGIIVEQLHWRWVFLAVPLLAVPAALLVRPALRGMTTPAAERTGGRSKAAMAKVAWAVAAAGGALLFQYGGQQTGLLAVAVMAAALAVLAAAVPRLLPRGSFSFQRGLPATIMMRGLAGAAFAAADVFIPLMLSRERGLSPAMAGLALTVGALFWSFGSWTQSRPNIRLSRAAIVRLGMAGILLGVVVVSLALIPAVPVALAMAGWSAAGFGMGMAYPTLSVLTLEASAPGEAGANSASLQLADSLASAAVLAIVGALFAALVTRPGPTAFIAVYAISALFAVVGLVLAGRVAGPSAARD
ncbi:MFS transporter [Phytomonospora sp. NPDC050363]|uniref:MFS transporter n=1 Tax=Phytomonospora sp. NPDC050363 TaxID=3155642 RepID=UPI0033E693D9